MAGLKLGLVQTPFENEGLQAKYITAAFLSAAETMRQAGAVVSDVHMDLNAADRRLVEDKMDECLFSEFKEDMGAYLAELRDSPVRTLQDLVHWNNNHAVSPKHSSGQYVSLTKQEEELPPKAPDQHRLIHALAAGARDTDTYRHAVATTKELAGRRGLDYIFDKHQLDAAVFTPGVGRNDIFTACTGYAAVSHTPDAILRPKLMRPGWGASRL
jgi:amidase